MQFVEDGISLSASAATEDNDVIFIMEDLGGDVSLEFNMKYPELLQLRDWLTKQIQLLRDDDKSEAP